MTMAVLTNRRTVLLKVMPHTEDTGLRGVKAATTRISMIDGELGQLQYRGYDIKDLAAHSTFEEVVHLLIRERMPKLDELKAFSREMASKRALPRAIVDFLMATPKRTLPMYVLQAVTALLPSNCPDLGVETREANERKAIRIVACLPTMVAAWKRIRRDLEPIDPREDLSHAANFLYMVNGEEPDPSIAHFLDVALILHAEHSFNASTFTARVVASTGASMYSAISAGIGSLAGPLHGGANAQVMRNLIDTHNEDSVESWVERQFKKGMRVSGMGHAVYKTIDPRALILQTMAQELLRDHPEYRWYQMTERMALATQAIFQRNKGRDIHPNVDLYSASIYNAMGIHLDFYPPVFAMARSAGWAAHVLEEKFPHPPVKPVLYRPSATYVGEVGCPYLPIEKR